MAKAHTLSEQDTKRSRTDRLRRQEVGFESNIQAVAQDYTELALQALVDVLTDRAQPASARIAAAKIILDRGYGRKNAPAEPAPKSPLEIALDAVLKNGTARTLLPVSARRSFTEGPMPE